MKPVSLLLLAGLVLANAIPSRCAAGPLVTLTTSSSSEELLRIAPGSTLTISVNITELESGDRFDSLAAAVAFDSLHLGDATLSPGDIIPDPLDDPLDFLGLTEPGFVEAAFTTLSGDTVDHVTSDGVFYTFTVAALRPGSGSLSLTFVDGTRFNDADPTSPIPLGVSAGSPLAYTVVPEPASIVLAAVPLLLIALVVVSRSRRACLR